MDLAAAPVAVARQELVWEVAKETQEHQNETVLQFFFNSNPKFSRSILLVAYILLKSFLRAWQRKTSA